MNRNRRVLPLIGLFLVVWLAAGLVIGGIGAAFQPASEDLSSVDWNAVKDGRPQSAETSDPATYLTADVAAEGAFAEVVRRTPVDSIFNPGVARKTADWWSVPAEVVAAAKALDSSVFPVVSKTSGKSWFSPVQVLTRDQEPPTMTVSERALLTSPTSFPQILDSPTSPWSAFLPSKAWWSASTAVCPNDSVSKGFCKYQADVRTAWTNAIQPLTSANLPEPTLTQLAQFQVNCIVPLSDMGTTGGIGFNRQSYPACSAAAAWIVRYKMP
ncbi:hypothetical protein [Gordonia tangerina]|uniref:SdpA family antimicrobial peptide system protein n=1 Tax=Gordonia tangerina TaxID=2911060 RepID=A0ABS9DFX6_9ACTN|nr:hypothetical protein [Gordonia tangerina]MCF3937185.1 hypothetical protein [Gordonia tangerina]